MKKEAVIFRIFLVVGLLVFIKGVSAATINALSCSQADVQTAIDSADSEDSVNIPSGTCTWSTGISIPDSKDIMLKGAGASESGTVIKHSSATAIAFYSASQVSGIKFVQSGSGESILAQGTGFRIHNCQFVNTVPDSEHSIVVSGININYKPYGLIDHNDFVQGRVVVNGMYTFAKDNILWASSIPWGTDSTTYIEDNTFFKDVGPGGDYVAGNVVDSSRGADYVFRYNTVTGLSQAMTHGLQLESACDINQVYSERAGRGAIFYGNSITADSPVENPAIFQRGGSGFIFGNVYNANHLEGFWRADCERIWRSGFESKQCGYCDGSSPWDGNILANGYPCRDQIGTGPDNWLWSPAANYPTQSFMSVYLWLNRQTTGVAATLNIAPADAGHIALNRDYYNEDTADCPADPSGSCTAGVGYGTLANRPAHCTPGPYDGQGVGYWATEDDYTDLSIYTGANHTDSFSGTLYKCTSTDTWTAYYTPFPYPHPLISEETGPVCGNGICESGETPESCPADCRNASSCISRADSDKDSAVSTEELAGYITEWKAGSVTIGELITAVNEWKNGC